MRFELAGKTALITGAGRGIGRALTGQLVDAGVARIIAVGRYEEALQALAAEHPGKIVPVACDLSDSGAVAELVAEASCIAPDLSLLFNNAGIQRLTDFTTESLASVWPDLQREIAVNLAAPIALATGLLPLLRSQRQSAIVNVTTGLVLAPKMSAPVYCATKAGLSSFTRSLRYQCEATAPNVRVIEALPPMVDTDMTRSRGRGKINADDCARSIIAGIVSGRHTIDVGKTRLLRLIMRISPAVGHGIMRRG